MLFLSSFTAFELGNNTFFPQKFAVFSIVNEMFVA